MKHVEDGKDNRNHKVKDMATQREHYRYFGNAYWYIVLTNPNPPKLMLNP